VFDEVYILFHFNIILKHNGMSSTKKITIYSTNYKDSNRFKKNIQRSKYSELSFGSLAPLFLSFPHKVVRHMQRFNHSFPSLGALLMRSSSDTFFHSHLNFIHSFLLNLNFVLKMSFVLFFLRIRTIFWKYAGRRPLVGSSFDLYLDDIMKCLI